MTQRLYKGFPVIHMEPHSCGTMPVCSVPCGKCGKIHEKSGSAVRHKPKRFICDECVNQPGVKVCEICGDKFDFDWSSRENKTCGPKCATVLRARNISATAARRRAEAQ